MKYIRNEFLLATVAVLLFYAANVNGMNEEVKSEKDSSFMTTLTGTDLSTEENRQSVSESSSRTISVDCDLSTDAYSSYGEADDEASESDHAGNGLAKKSRKRRAHHRPKHRSGNVVGRKKAGEHKDCGDKK
ncbi:hypothetical protein FACS189449_03510 [Alphaproteobacteria bacterium]|nr:hypothetical protein FACS189449_03510 [Alphaproteobacteria bacterium]